MPSRTRRRIRDGPFPSDTIFLKGSRGNFDAIVAMYHDHGHIPVKTLGFEEGVNVTIGLPIIRTLVDHGTAFDIAWKGKANPRSRIEAIRLASEWRDLKKINKMINPINLRDLTKLM